MADLKTKTFAGQPAWVWAAGGAAVLGGLIYVLYKSRQAGMSSAAGETTGTQRAPGPVSFQAWIADHQASPATVTKTCPKGYRYHPKLRRCVPAPRRRRKKKAA